MLKKEITIYVLSILEKDDKPSDMRFIAFDTLDEAEDFAEPYVKNGTLTTIEEKKVIETREIK